MTVMESVRASFAIRRDDIECVVRCESYIRILATCFV